MSSLATTLLDARSLSEDAVMERSDWLDLGAYKELNVEFQYLTKLAGGGATGDLYLEHAAVPEEDAFVALTAATLDLDVDSEGPAYVHVSSFLRYVRWKATISGTPTTSAVAAIYLVAKD